MKGESFMKKAMGVKTTGGIFLAVTAALWVFCGGAFAGDAMVTLTRQYYVEDESPVLDLNAVRPDKEIAFEFSFTNAKRTDYRVMIYNSDGSQGSVVTSPTSNPNPDGTGTRTVRLTIPAGQSAEVEFIATDAAGAQTTETYALRATGTPIAPIAPDVPSSGGGGGGCSTGFGAGTLMLLAALMLTGKTRR
jgi:hypothetical protein